MWEQEFILADCPDGDAARAIFAQIARALASDSEVLDLRDAERVAEDSDDS